MWTDLIHLTVGRFRVGVRPDCSRTRAQLVALLSKYQDQYNDPDHLPRRSNFSLRRPTRALRRRHGEFFIAGVPVTRSKDLSELAHVLTAQLAGLAAQNGVGTIISGSRVFALGDRAVIVDAERSVLGGEIGADIREVHVWEPRIDAELRRVLLPDALPGLDWSAAGLDPPAGHPSSLDLVGVVARSTEAGMPEIGRIWLNSTGNLDEWGVVLTEMLLAHRVLAGASSDDIRLKVRELLEAPH